MICNFTAFQRQKLPKIWNGLENSKNITWGAFTDQSPCMICNFASFQWGKTKQIGLYITWMAKEIKNVPPAAKNLPKDELTGLENWKKSPAAHLLTNVWFAIWPHFNWTKTKKNGLEITWMTLEIKNVCLAAKNWRKDVLNGLENWKNSPGAHLLTHLHEWFAILPHFNGAKTK